MRLFFAINLPDNIKENLVPVMENMQKLNPHHSLKWVKTKSLHLTLHFLGEQSNAMADKIIKTVDDLGDGFEAINVKVGEWGGFPNLHCPKILFFTLKDSQALHDLYKKIGSKLKTMGLETEKRAWKTHVTVARNKNAFKPIKINPAELPNLEWQVQSFELMKSNLLKDGAEYEVVKSFNLGK